MTTYIYTQDKTLKQHTTDRALAVLSAIVSAPTDADSPRFSLTTQVQESAGGAS